MKKNIRILFVGNSHTYYNDMPLIVRELFAKIGVCAEVTMQTRGGKNLIYHSQQKDVIFNILHGNYDYVVLQEVASSFEPENFRTGLEAICEQALSKSSSAPILYMIWAHRDDKRRQTVITEEYVNAAERIGARLAPAGEVWHKLLRGNKSLPFYCEDGNHATPTGSYLAACSVFYAIADRERPVKLDADGELEARLDLDVELCRKIHSETCRAAKKYNSK